MDAPPTDNLRLFPFSSQYHQVYDDDFISAVVLSLILATLFGLIYLLVIPQYVPSHKHTHTHTNTRSDCVFSPLSGIRRLLFSLQGNGGAAAAGAVLVFPCGLRFVPASYQHSGRFHHLSFSSMEVNTCLSVS